MYTCNMRYRRVARHYPRHTGLSGSKSQFLMRALASGRRQVGRRGNTCTGSPTCPVILFDVETIRARARVIRFFGPINTSKSRTDKKRPKNRVRPVLLFFSVIRFFRLRRFPKKKKKNLKIFPPVFCLVRIFRTRRAELFSSPRIRSPSSRMSVNR